MVKGGVNLSSIQRLEVRQIPKTNWIHQGTRPFLGASTWRFLSFWNFAVF